MSTIDVIYLSGIIGAFIVFAAALAFVQYQTRHFDGAKIKGADKPKDTPGKPTVSARWPNAA